MMLPGRLSEQGLRRCCTVIGRPVANISLVSFSHRCRFDHSISNANFDIDRFSYNRSISTISSP